MSAVKLNRRHQQSLGGSTGISSRR